MTLCELTKLRQGLCVPQILHHAIVIVVCHPTGSMSSMWHEYIDEDCLSVGRGLLSLTVRTATSSAQPIPRSQTIKQRSTPR